MACRFSKALAVGVLFLVVCSSTATTEEHAGNEAVESSESWTGWAKDKISEGLGLDTKDDATIDSAKHKITGSGEYSAEKAKEMKEKAESVKDMSCEKAQRAKERVKEEAEKVKEMVERGEEWAKEQAKQGVEATKQKAREGVESAREAVREKYEEPARQKANDFKEDVILGGRSSGDEL